MLWYVLYPCYMGFHLYTALPFQDSLKASGMLTLAVNIGWTYQTWWHLYLMVFPKVESVAIVSLAFHMTASDLVWNLASFLSSIYLNFGANDFK